MYRNTKTGKRKFYLAKALFFIMVAIAMALLLGWIVMVLWNAILPDVAGVKPLNYWQAIGLFILSRILFGGFRFGSRRNKGRRFQEKWNEKWKKKW